MPGPSLRMKKNKSPQSLWEMWAKNKELTTTKPTMKHLKKAVNITELAIYYCHPGACQTKQKLAYFYMLITLKQKKVVEKSVLW